MRRAATGRCPPASVCTFVYAGKSDQIPVRNFLAKEGILGNVSFRAANAGVTQSGPHTAPPAAAASLGHGMPGPARGEPRRVAFPLFPLSMETLFTVDAIRRVPLFTMLTASQAQGIADVVVRQRYKRGDFILRQGGKSDALFILLSGRAHVMVADDRGREVVLALVKPGDYVGEMSLIDDQPHSASVVADVQCDVLVLARAPFAACLPKNANLAYSVLRGLVRRLRGANRQIESLALYDVHGRVARTLLDLAEPGDGAPRIAPGLSRTNLAKMVGASREMVGPGA